ncbi:DUF3592 domain-containing protein [Ruegeria sp. HKCCD8929]|uniref:DUF3592 domain-containing protein n=1 Tax=Ruegeria sp. HKCCD8929 TaxID=2683006 RepID=UPI0014899088|nr:DUF3592 domain-containing protein [Ruegeria sp. HKCCD8929]
MQTRTLGYGMACLGLIILVFTLSDYRDVRTLRNSGVETSAKLNHLVRYKSLRQNYYSASYKFEHEGREIKADDIRVSVPSGRKLEAQRKKQPNTQIDIYYLPSRPELTLPSIAVDTFDFVNLKLILALGMILAPLGEWVFSRKP